MGMSKKKLRFLYDRSLLSFMELFMDDSALVKKVVLAVIDEIEPIPPLDWKKGKDDAVYWHSAYQMVYKFLLNKYALEKANQLTNELTSHNTFPQKSFKGG